jgi:hypothetical protein
MQVITSLPPADTGADLSYHKLSDQLDLLSKVSHISSILAAVSGQAVTYRARSMKSLNATCASLIITLAVGWKLSHPTFYVSWSASGVRELHEVLAGSCAIHVLVSHLTSNVN